MMQVLMKRRSFVQALAAAPVTAVLLAQPAPPARPAAVELPKLEASVPDFVAQSTPRFFTPLQFATLSKVSGTLMPPMGGRPGALEVQAPEFLDFLIGESLPDRKDLYRAGLDGLNAQAKKSYNKPCADLDAGQMDALFSPLREPWTLQPPADPVARFLRAAKQDVRTATVNSRAYATAAAATQIRRFGGGGQYWYPLD